MTRASHLRRRLLAAAALTAALPAPALALRRNPRIFMLLYRGETPVEQGFRDWFREHGLAPELRVRNIDMDLERVPALLAEARAWGADLLYTWGTPLTLAVAGKEGEVDAARHVTDIPIVFTMVSAPVDSGLVRSATSSRRNLTGVSHVVPAALQVDAIRKYGRFARIGAIYNPQEVNARISVEALAAAARRVGMDVNALPVPLDAQGKPDADALPGLAATLAADHADLLYVGPDSFLAAHRKRLTASALALRLPVFSVVEVALRDGDALFGLVAGYPAIGRLTAHKAAQILYHHARPAALPVETPGHYAYLVNMRVARELGMTPAPQLRHIAEQIP